MFKDLGKKLPKMDADKLKNFVGLERKTSVTQPTSTPITGGAWTQENVDSFNEIWGGDLTRGETATLPPERPESITRKPPPSPAEDANNTSDTPTGEVCQTCPKCSFKNYYNTLLKHEGGFVNDPDDPGGATNKGITFTTFKAFAKSAIGIEPTLDNLKALTDEQAYAIYEQQYWNKIKGSEFKNCELAYQVVDFYINAGGNGNKVFQRTINELGQSTTVDGVIGKNTVTLANSMDAAKLYVKFRENRIKYYISLTERNTKLKKFLKGWTNRANSFDAY